jgi:NADPH:quinone reductase-like Zn-dependent oxidoreductase
VRAAVIREFGRAPTYAEFPDPTAGPGETLVSVTASALGVLTLSRAAGAHYSASRELPIVAGVDGVGRTPDGRRVYFQTPRPPFGALAERAPVRTDRLIPVPEGLDDISAAAAAIAGMSCWLPLTLRAPIRPGESVLVNGATGSSGRMAVQVAKHLGAARVVATGRDPAKLATLRALGADRVLPLGGPPEELRRTIREEAAASSIGVVLDYLWGPSAESILAALGGPGAPRGADRIRYVEIGAIAGDAIALSSTLLRASGVEILGSGIGGATDVQVLTAFREFLSACETARFRVETDPRPLASVEQAWGRTGEERRIVFTVP